MKGIDIKKEVEEFKKIYIEQYRKFQVISNSKNDAIITSDESKNILFWNKGAEHIFGYTEDEVIGKPITIIIPDRFHKMHNDGMDRMNKGGKPRSIGKVLELSAIKKGGEEFPIELTLGSWDNEGKRYYSGIIRDITEKKKAENLLQIQNKRFQVISSSKNDAIVTSDESKKILFWSKGAEHIFGYTEKEALGKPITLIIPNEFKKRHNDGMDRMNKGGKPRSIGKVLELSAIKKGGEEFPIELTLGSWDNEGKRYYSGIIRDITEKKKAENLLQEQNKRFQVISNSKNDAIITSDESKKILFWNKGAEHIFGYKESEVLGKPITIIIPDKFKKLHNAGMDRMNKGGKPRAIGNVIELSAIKKGGEEFPIELTLGSWDNEGKRYYSGIIRDITEKKKAENIIIEEKKKSEEL
ncbi:MAG: PAS domain-containing protein [Flavobacteriales bacterium]|nr:PAS domain-containing protein [Flavobacteriales bacterium]